MAVKVRSPNHWTTREFPRMDEISKGVCVERLEQKPRRVWDSCAGGQEKVPEPGKEQKRNSDE